MSTELHAKSQPLHRNKSKNTIVLIFNLNMTSDHGIVDGSSLCDEAHCITAVMVRS